MTQTPPENPIAETRRPYLLGTWQERLANVVTAVREMSRQTEPHEMVKAYGQRMRSLWIADRTISVSRRGHVYPEFRITRSSTWDTVIDPWLQRDRLPIFKGGVLADLLYGNEPRFIDPFDPPSPRNDPAWEYLAGMRAIVAIPHYENGEGLNMVLHMREDSGGFDPDRFPELVQMSNLFGRATKNLVLSKDLQAANEQLDAELKAVQDIQLSLLPQTNPAISTLDLATHYQTSKRAGGDYYDFFKLPEDRWGMIVADVSGHGTPAAVLMAIVHAIAHLMPGEPWPADRVMGYMNRALAARYTRDGGAFVTAIYGIYDPRQRLFSFASAGHPDPLVRRPDGTITPVSHPGGGLPLGLMDDAEYGTQTVQLRPGEALILYTDGITEAFNTQKAMFGNERLHRAILRAPMNADAIVSAIIEDVGAFAGLDSRSDDRTLLVGVVK